MKPNLNDQTTNVYEEAALARRVVLVDGSGNIYTASGTTASATSTVTALQGTSPWVISGTTTVSSGTITAQQGTDPWKTTSVLTDGVTATTKATIATLTNANPLTVAIVDANGDQITSFGGTTTSVTALQGEPPWTITGTTTALQGTNPWTVSVTAGTSTEPYASRLTDGTTYYKALMAGEAITVTSGTITAQQGTTPWTVTGSVTALMNTGTSLIRSNVLVPSNYDYISLEYTGSNLTTAIFKTGGSGGSTVATLVLGYSGSTLTSVTKT